MLRNITPIKLNLRENKKLANKKTYFFKCQIFFKNIINT